MECRRFARLSMGGRWVVASLLLAIGGWQAAAADAGRVRSGGRAVNSRSKKHSLFLQSAGCRSPTRMDGPSRGRQAEGVDQRFRHRGIAARYRTKGRYAALRCAHTAEARIV